MNKNVLIVLAVIVVVGFGFMLLGKNTNTPSPVETGAPSASVAETGEKAAVTNNTENNSPVPENESEESVIKTFTVESNGLNFTPNVLKVELGDRVKVIYKNNQGTHNWTLDEFNAKTKLIDAGKTDTVEFTADKTGNFEFYCSVSGHQQAGMKGTLVVD